MSSVTIPRDQWNDFLCEFSRRHHNWLVKLETHDVETSERVVSRDLPLQSIELDLEDEKNPRINVTVRSDNKVIKHIFFMPSDLELYRSEPGADEALHISSLNTETTVRLRAAIPPELVDDVA